MKDRKFNFEIQGEGIQGEDAKNGAYLASHICEICSQKNMSPTAIVAGLQVAIYALSIDKKCDMVSVLIDSIKETNIKLENEYLAKA